MNHAIPVVVGVLTDLADDAPRNTGPDFGKASPFGLLVIVLLLLGTFALVWSMNRQLKKVPKSFEEESPATGQPGSVDQSGDTGSPGGPTGASTG